MLLWNSTGARLWRSPKGISHTKDAERRDKVESALREGHAVGARPVKTFRNAGDGKNATAGLWMKSNLREKRRDPWHRANAPSEAAADPELIGKDAEKAVTDVSLPGSQAGGATTSPSELKSLTQHSSDRKALDGPATRPELRLPWRIASGSRQPLRGA